MPLLSPTLPRDPVLYTNAKLYKIGFKLNDSCSFCSSEPETLYHFLYLCPFSVDFWRDFEVFWHQLLKENIRLSLQDVLVGMIRYKYISLQSKKAKDFFEAKWIVSPLVNA